MPFDPIIQGLVFYVGWKAVERVYRVAAYKRLKIKRDLINSARQRRKDKEYFEAVERERQERLERNRRVWTAFTNDAKKLAGPVPSRDVYVTTPWGFINKEDTQLLLERHPEVHLDLDDWSSSIQRTDFADAISSYRPPYNLGRIMKV